MPLRRLVLLFAAAVLVLGACGSDDEPEARPVEPPPEGTALPEAASATLEEGSGTYSLVGTPRGAAGEREPEPGAATRVTGRVDFATGMRELAIIGGEAERRVVVDQEHLFFQRNPAQQGVWRKVPLAQLATPPDGAPPAESLSAETLVALHDPALVLASLRDARAEESSTGRYELVLSRAQVGGMLADALGRIGLDELTVTAQVETERVVGLQYHLQPRAPAPVEGAEGAPVPRLGEAMVTVTFESFGLEELAVPAEAENIDVFHVRPDLRVDLGLPEEVPAPVQQPDPAVTAPDGDEEAEPEPSAGSGPSGG